MITHLHDQLPEMICSPATKLYPAIPTRIEKQLELVTAGLVHELRNPLTTINMALELLKPLAGEDDQKILLDIIKRGSQKLNTLVNELLLQQHFEQIKAEKYSLHQLLNEVLTNAADRILMKNILVLRTYSILDHDREEDRQGLKIALTNIISNAIEAMKQKGVLKINTFFGDGSFVVQIEDNGSGISDKNMEQLFSHRFTTKKDGKGVGLAVTGDILRANNINLDVESDEGFGTKFTLTFD